MSLLMLAKNGIHTIIIFQDDGKLNEINEDKQNQEDDSAGVRRYILEGEARERSIYL